MFESSTKVSRAILVTALITVAMGGCDRGHPSAGTETIDQLKQGIETKHPATYYTLAGKLFHDQKKDEAVFWYYLGQLRYRFHLTVSKNLDPSGDPALFGSLSEVLGRPVNQYAFGDIPRLAATIDKVLEWDAAHENGFTPKKGNEASLEQIRSRLLDMKTLILKDQDKIKAQRKATGLQ
jgi:hypothetical protein